MLPETALPSAYCHSAKLYPTASGAFGNSDSGISVPYSAVRVPMSSLDTENAEVHDEMINGKKAVIITKEEVSQLCLIDEKKGNYLLITGSMEQTDDLVKIAQNIQFE